MELLCDGHHGQFIPQIMARRLFEAGWSGIDLGDVVELDAGPYESGWYWDAWNDVLNEAHFTDERGAVWYLYHDGDLFAVTALDLEEMGVDHGY